MKKSLFTLALGTFGLGITEFSTMAILPYIAQDIHIDIPKAGTFVSVYLLGVGTGAVLLAFAGRFGLKQILLTLIGLVALGNLCSSLATDYLPLLLCRFMAGLPHGAFYGTSAVVAGRLADEGKGNRAVAVVMTGMMVANLVGVPLATALGAMVSWRLVFVAVGCWALLVLAAIWRYVPSLENTQTVSIGNQLAGLKKTEGVVVAGGHLLGQRSSVRLVQLHHAAANRSGRFLRYQTAPPHGTGRTGYGGRKFRQR